MTSFGEFYSKTDDESDDSVDKESEDLEEAFYRLCWRNAFSNLPYNRTNSSGPYLWLRAFSIRSKNTKADGCANPPFSS